MELVYFAHGILKHCKQWRSISIMNILIYEIVNLHMELLNRSRFSIACPIGHAKFPGADAEIILGRNRGHEPAAGREGQSGALISSLIACE